MQFPLTSMRALAGLAAALLVASMLSVLTAGNAGAAEGVQTPPATLSGSLTYPDGSPVASGDAYVYPADSGPGDAYSYLATIAAGSFSVPVDAGSWRVVIRTGDEDYLDHTYDDVTVTSGQHLTLPAVQLRQPVQTSVSGTVTVQGSPRSGLEVNLIRVTDDGDWIWVSTTTTDSKGDYTLAGVRDDRRYTVRVHGQGISPTLLGGSDDPASAATFTSADRPRLPTIDVLPAATISGVLLADGQPVRGDVNVYSITDGGSHVWKTYAYTDSAGRWSLEVPAGDYVIKAHAYDVPFVITYLGARHAEDLAEAGSFHVEAGQSVTKDVAMRPAASLTGVVTADGSPEAGAYVMAFVWDETRQLWDFATDDHTDQDGAYSLPVREGSRVTVRVSREGFVPQFLGGGADFPGPPTAANSVTAQGRTTTLPAFVLVPVAGATPPPTPAPAPTPTASPSPTPSTTPVPTPTPVPVPVPEPVPVPVPEQTTAKVTVKGPTRVSANKRAVLTVRVRAGAGKPRPTATGRVVIKMTARGKVSGKDVCTMRVRLEGGRARFRLPRLTQGTWAIHATYKGSADIEAAAKHVLTVKAPGR